MTQKAHFFIAASPKVRKKMLRDIIVNIDIFRKIIDLIKQTEDGFITKDELSRYLSEHQILFTTDTTEDYTSDFDSFIEWGRQALIFHYDANDERNQFEERRPAVILTDDMYQFFLLLWNRYIINP